MEDRKMEKDSESALKMHFLYAFPCLEGRLARGSVTGEEFSALEESLKKMLENGQCPDFTLICKAFPEAKEDLEKVAQKNGRTVAESFHPKDVEEFWHGHDGRGFPGCGVIIYTVREVESGKIIIKIQRGDEFPQVNAFNRYSLPLRVGDRVFVHLHTVIEKIEESPKS